MNEHMRRFIVLASLVFVAIAAASARSASAPVISAIKIAPTPFYDDEPFMTVKFRTSVAAPAGKLYFLQWEADGAVGTTPDNCSVLSNADPIGYKGGPSVTVTAKLVPDPIFGGNAFCPGPSIIQFTVQPAKANRHARGAATKKTGKLLVVYDFRVYRQP